MNWLDIRRKHALPDANSALPGRAEAMSITNRHAVLNTPLLPPYAAHLEQALFGMGCFWGVDRAQPSGRRGWVPRLGDSW